MSAYYGIDQPICNRPLINSSSITLFNLTFTIHEASCTRLTLSVMSRNRFIHTREQLTTADLHELENALGVKLPDEFREHYLRNNGGSPERYLYKVQDSFYVVREFYAINHGPHK